MPADDLNCLLNSTGFPLSRKVFSALISENGSDRVSYRDFVPPPSMIDYELNYPSLSKHSSINPTATTTDSIDGPLIVERNLIQYNVDELIKQSILDQQARVRLSEELSISNSKIGMIGLKFDFIFNYLFKLSNLGTND